MPKTNQKQNTRKPTKPATPTPVEEKPVVQEQETKKSRQKKQPVPQEVVPQPQETSESNEDATTQATTKTRHVPTRESVEREFTEIVQSIEDEINKLRASTAKSKGVKFLRSINKRVKNLKNHALRISKQKTTNRRKNVNSGFLKPVQISADLARFTGWNQSELKSRVDVTKYICDYVKQHNLQDSKDRRNIKVNEDPKLQKLLKYDPKENKPLTYYSLQTYLKSHFTPAPAQS
jgi:chromatin remodeling complex protein RSC6